MKKCCPFVFVLLITATLNAQQRPARNPAPEAGTNAPAAPATPQPSTREEKPSPTNLVFNPESSVTTNHEVTIKGQKIPYKATAGTMPVWDEDGKTNAGKGLKT